MRRVVVDASALAALVFNEPGAEEVARRLEGAQVHAPTLLPYELGNPRLDRAHRPSRTVRTATGRTASERRRER